MSLVFAGITPHPPSLIPQIGKEEGLEKLLQTKQAMEKLEQDLYLAKPDVLIIISPHEGLFADAFVVNAHTSFVASLEQFGHLTDHHTWIGIPELAAKISHTTQTQKIPLRLVSEEKLSYGAVVPLYYLTAHVPKMKILPVGFSNLTPKDHVAFGELLKEIIMEDDKRVAVIASGDLSHCLRKHSPVPYNKHGAQFDATLIELLETRNTVGITQMDKTMVIDAHECGYRSVLILLGILKNMDYTFKNYSYEYPFGVGYLVGNFNF